MTIPYAGALEFISSSPETCCMEINKEYLNDKIYIKSDHRHFFFSFSAVVNYKIARARREEVSDRIKKQRIEASSVCVVCTSTTSSTTVPPRWILGINRDHSRPLPTFLPLP